MLNDNFESLDIQEQFIALNEVLLNVMAELTKISNPVASSAIQDLSEISKRIKTLQDGVFTHLEARRLKLDALMGVGHMINSSKGLSTVLDEVMDVVIALMRAERGLIMLRDGSDDFPITAARGIAQVDLDDEAFAISKTIVHHVAQTGESVLTMNAQDDPRFNQQKSVVAHNLRSIICVPLKLKEEIIGVIFVDNRVHSGLFHKEDQDVLSAFADQAAVAIENARLFENLENANFNLEKANQNLLEAYDETLKGWALALEYRDEGTEGHTQRVTALTLKLAQKMGINGTELEHVKRGALLHDIGKISIPDSILLKPGELSLPERKFMELHPIFAKDLLEKIEFLRPALEIPFCHHEKWDGSGYPQNLKGEEIPFAARIFAVVDVWDALTSERPYRAPVEPSEVRRIIQEKAGSHFDPKVVDAFLELENLPVAPRTGDTELIQTLRY